MRAHRSARSVGQEIAQGRLPAAEDEQACSFGGERLHGFAFGCEFVTLQRRFESELEIDGGEQVALDAIAEGFETEQTAFRGVPLRTVDVGPVKPANGMLEGGEPARGKAVARFADGAGKRAVHSAADGSVAEVEKRGDGGTRHLEHAVVNLVGGNGKVAAGGHGAISAAEHAQEAGTAFVDNLAAHLGGILLTGDAPSQIHIQEMDAPRKQLLPKAWKDESDKVVALRLHVAKCGAYEYANDFPRVRHLSPSPATLSPDAPKANLAALQANQEGAGRSQRTSALRTLARNGGLHAFSGHSISSVQVGSNQSGLIGEFHQGADARNR